MTERFDSLRADAPPGGELIRTSSREYNAIELYDRAVLALDRATTLVETMGVHNMSEALKLQGRLAKDPEAIAKAVELRFRSERKLGGMLSELKDRGELRSGKAGAARVSLLELGIDHKLSSQSQKLFAYDAGEFERVVGQGLEKIRAGRAVVVNPIKDLTTADKKLRRAIKAAQLAERAKALPAGKHQVILADPEWPDETWSDNGKDRSPENHYPTSTIEEIAARPVGDIAADDALMVMWITSRHLAIGSHLPVLRSWGFEPRALLFWDKVVAGNGRWSRNRVEIVVIAVRGTMPAPAPGTQWEDLIPEMKTQHSAKPDWLHRWVEDFYPGTKRIELNARTAREGWARWGNEAPEEESSSDGSSTDDAEVFADKTTAPADEARETVSSAAIRQDDSVDAAGATRAGVPGRHETLQDEPADATGDTLPSGRSYAAGGAGEEADDAEPDAGAGERAGEGAGSKQAPSVLPHSTIAAADLTSAQKNDIIRAAYGFDEFPGIAFLADRTGLKPDAVKQRARYMELGDPKRQVAAFLKAVEAQRQGRAAA